MSHHYLTLVTVIVDVLFMQKSFQTAAKQLKSSTKTGEKANRIMFRKIRLIKKYCFFFSPSILKERLINSKYEVDVIYYFSQSSI